MNTTTQMTLHVLASDAPTTRIIVAHYRADGSNVANYAYDADDAYVELNTNLPETLRVGLGVQCLYFRPSISGRVP